MIEDLNLEILEDEAKKLSDETSTLYLFDLAYALKNKLKIKHPDEELHPAKHFLSLCEKYGAISSATYKGGDLDYFINKVKELEINSVTAEFNSSNQVFMQEFYDKCIKEELLPFVRTLVAHPRKKPDNKFLDESLAIKFNETASCIVGHEISSSINPEDGMFTKSTVERFPSIEERIKLYSRVGTK